MARIISKIDITLPEIITGIDERNFWTRHCWKRDESEIKRRIIDKFEEGLLSACPYSDENIPREVVKSSIKIDGRNNTEIYIMAEKFIELGKKRASGFEEMLFAESLKTLGVQRPETVASLAYPFENITITHKLEPRTSSKYAEIVGAFISPAPAKVIRVDSKIGDLIKANMFLDKDSFENLRNKGLVDNKFMDSYKPIIREGKVYINP